MKKIRILPVLLAIALLAGCGSSPEQPRQYQASFLTLFDTVTTILGYGVSEEEFEQRAGQIHDELLRYHQLFDIYREYEGMNNLKTVNDQAGIRPVAVDRQILELLKDCKKYYALTGGKVNAAMGSVLALWHDARTAGIDFPDSAALPRRDALEEAALHCSPDDIILDEAAGTVYLRDPEMRLDVGAIAKGWSVQRVAEAAPAGLLISVGGNVCATGPKPGGNPWVVGVQRPDGEDYVHTLNIPRGSVVTSGDYQRYYVVEGIRYHHIIDPETLEPERLWRSVTVVSDDSGLGDCLSTALFLLPLQEGLALLEDTGAEALWIDGEGKLSMSPGFEALIRN